MTMYAQNNKLMSCREKVHDFKIGTNFLSKHSKIQNQLEIVLFGSKRLQFKSNMCVCQRDGRSNYGYQICIFVFRKLST